ncbi:MAG: zeta toxin family protein [Bacillota bacterium]|nr:zeta toxin family protein [Bacillota bacterium]
MEKRNMRTEKKPEIIVFAGPNGSGKSSITREARIVGKYVNADDIKKEKGCSDLEAAEIADEMREGELESRRDFTFETVLSTRRKIDLLNRAKEKGYFIRCVYVLTRDPNINVYRVVSRMESGGHGVPADKVIERYFKCIRLIPEIYQLSDTFYLFDNSAELTRIAVKKRGQLDIVPSDMWSEPEIRELLEGKQNGA